MTPGMSAIRWLLSRLCSGHLLEYVVEPSLADLEYTSQDGRFAYARLVNGYARVLMAVFISLPRDIAVYRRPSGADVLRLVVAIAFPGLTPGLTTSFIRSRKNSARPPIPEHPSRLA